MPRLLPSLCVGFLIGGAAGYFATHTPTADELKATVGRSIKEF